MNLRTLSVIALSNRDFPSSDAKIAEAVSWLELAAGQGAELVVFPECLNRFCGDGVNNPLLQTAAAAACRDWRREMAPLLEAAQRCRVWLTVPVMHFDEAELWNSFFLVSPEGEELWRYDKVSPTPAELDDGVIPGQLGKTFDWRGVKLGGAICFDTCFPENLERLANDEVQLVLCPSLWPGGSQLNHFCKMNSTRVALAYPAWSRIIDIDGEDVVAGGLRQETLGFGFGAPVFTATLNFDRVSLYGNGNQNRIAEMMRKYGSRLGITFDQGNCLWFLESRDQELAESEVMKEFELVAAREYFSGCHRRIEEARA